jgi:hypothetical protein
VTAHAQHSIAYITARQTGRGSRRADRITMEVIQSADNDRFGQKLRSGCKKWAVRLSEKTLIKTGNLTTPRFQSKA